MTAHIYFHHNNIRSLPTNLIYGSKSLRSADFEYNRLQAVRFVKPENRLKSKNMNTFDLSRNWRMGQDLNTVIYETNRPILLRQLFKNFQLKPKLSFLSENQKNDN